MDQLARFGVHLLETLFFTGLAGAVSVVVLSFVEDLHELFQSDDRA